VLLLQKKFEEAIGRSTTSSWPYPQGDKVPAAYLKKGFAFMEIGKRRPRGLQTPG
jgi:hypothetical protein